MHESSMASRRGALSTERSGYCMLATQRDASLTPRVGASNRDRRMCLGIPGEIIELHQKHGLRFGRVRFGGIIRDVCLDYQPDAEVGDFVLVHVGFAIARIDREEAERAWEVLEVIGQTAEVAP